MRKRSDFSTYTFSAPTKLIRALDAELAEEGQRSRFIRQAIEARLRERQRRRRRAAAAEKERAA